MKKKIVISEFMDAPAVAALSERHEVIYDPELVSQRERLKALVANAEVLIVRNLTQVNEDLLAACAKLRFVGRLGVGLDNIDLQACKGRGIKVQPATGANSAAVAEYVITSALVLLRGAYASVAEVAGGAWPRARLSQGREVAGKTLGLVGFGSIGREVASRARALGMKVAAFDPAIDAGAALWRESGVRPLALEELLAESDAVSLHIPLTDGTRNLLDAKRLAGMKRGAVVVNTARGGVLDEAALAAAIMSGHLGGAAIDVFEKEPLGKDSAWAACVESGANVILTPHIAGVTQESNERVSSLIAQETLRFLGDVQ